MSPEKQRIAIAEACGISICQSCCNEVDPKTCHCGDRIFPGKGSGMSHEGHNPIPVGCMCGYPTMSQEHWLGIPDYLNDLNAMHEAETFSLTTERLKIAFKDWLTRILPGENPSGWNWRYQWHATATERAEAFLRTIGEWEESV